MAHILIVDDNKQITTLLKYMLEKEHIMGTARDGQEAIDYLRDNNGQVDLVICDLIMPRVNGVDAIQALKAVYNGNLKIIAMTGHAIDSIIKNVKGMGINAFLMKPFGKQEFLDLVDTVLNQ